MSGSLKVKITICIVCYTFTGITSMILAQNKSNPYVNDMDYMIVDVKQAFIKEKIRFEYQINYMLEGFKKMKVNGIRVPIFSESHYPDKALLKKFVERANEEGFYIFANPWGSAGGKRVANDAYGDDDPKNVSVYNNLEKTQYYIDVIKAYAQEFECTWISPFNEDGRPGGLWSAAQINIIYSSLKGNLNGAELIGHCSWGIPAGIEVMEKTLIRNYISVSTTHNLGFHHPSWRRFIQLSREKGLPVWDSECTDHPKDGQQPRMDAALEYGVDAIVMYDGWKAVDMNNGSLKDLAYELMSKYLRVSETPYIESFADLRLSIPGGDPEQFVSGTSGLTFIQGDATKATFSSTSSLINGSNAMILLYNKGSKGRFILPLANGIHSFRFNYTRAFNNAEATGLKVSVGDSTFYIDDITQTVGSFFMDGLNINDSTSLEIELTGNNACTIDDVMWSDQYGGALPLGIAKTHSSTLKIYPNPASEVLNVECNEPVKKIVLTDLTGKVVASFNEVSHINVSDIKSGNYILGVQTRENMYLKKVVIR